MFQSAHNSDEAIDEVVRWADSLPGEFAVDVTDYDDGLLIEVRGTLLSSGLSLAALLRLGDELDVPQYRFHLQHDDGRLLWRRDRHPGHAHEPGMTGPEHVHRVVGGREVRRPSGPVELATIPAQIITANLEYAK